MIFDLVHSLDHNQLFAGGLFLMAIGAGAAYLRRVPGYLMGTIRRRFIWTVEVHDRDQSYRWFQKWFSDQEGTKTVRELVVSTQCGNDVIPQIGSTTPSSLLLSPAPGLHLVRYRGHRILVTKGRRDIATGNQASFAESLTFRWFGLDRTILDAIMADIAALASEPVAGIKILATYGDGWRQTIVESRRPVGSLILDGSILPDLIADLRTFLASEPWYSVRGIPYHRSYLFFGPHGGGKTTTALVVAGELGFSVACLSLKNPDLSDDRLRTLMANLPPKTILVMEDVDRIFSKHQDDDQMSGITMSGLLNAIDGIGSPRGMILIMTSNHPDRLDKALVRPGRVDRKVEFGHATQDQARRMFLWFYQGIDQIQPDINAAKLAFLAERFAAYVTPGRIPPAAIQEHLARFRDDPEGCRWSADLNGILPDERRDEIAGRDVAGQPIGSVVPSRPAVSSWGPTVDEQGNPVAPNGVGSLEAIRLALSRERGAT